MNSHPEQAVFTPENTPLRQQGPGVLVEYQPDAGKDEIGNLQAVTAALVFTADRKLGNLPQMIYPDFSETERALGVDKGREGWSHDGHLLAFAHLLADGVTHPTDQPYSLDGEGGNPINGRTVFGHNAHSEHFLPGTWTGQQRWYRARAQLVRTAENSVVFGVTNSDGRQMMDNAVDLRDLFSGTTLSEQTGTPIDISVPDQPEVIPTFRLRTPDGEPHPSIIPLGHFQERVSELAKEHDLDATLFSNNEHAWRLIALMDSKTKVGLFAVLRANGPYDYTECVYNPPRTKFKESKDGVLTLIDADTGQHVQSGSTDFFVKPFVKIGDKVELEFDPETDFAPRDGAALITTIVKDLHSVLISSQ